MALIQIAHPKFRSWLIAEAKRRNYIYRDLQEPPMEVSLYPDRFVKHTATRDGSPVLLRPVRPTDEKQLHGPFYSLSPSQETMVQRFFAVRQSRPKEGLRDLCNPDFERDFTTVACTGDDEESQQIVGMGGFFAKPGQRYAEVAFVVIDSYQGQGIGTLLLEHLIQIARVKGLAGFTARAQENDEVLRKIFGAQNYSVSTSLIDGTQELTMHFREHTDEPVHQGAARTPRSS